MQKIKLDLDDLRVESFQTTPEETGGQGTVVGLANFDVGDGTVDVIGISRGHNSCQTCIDPSCPNSCIINTCGCEDPEPIHTFQSTCPSGPICDPFFRP